MRFENMGLVAQEIGGDIIGQDDFETVFTQWDIYKQCKEKANHMHFTEHR